MRLKECCLKLHKSVKRSQKQNRRKNKKRKKQRAEKKFKEITELISADISQPIITDVNVKGVVSLTRDQIRYLKEMAKHGKISEKALSTIEEYIPGLLKENGNFLSEKTIKVKVLEVKVNQI